MVTASCNLSQLAPQTLLSIGTLNITHAAYSVAKALAIDSTLTEHTRNLLLLSRKQLLRNDITAPGLDTAIITQHAGIPIYALTCHSASRTYLFTAADLTPEASTLPEGIQEIARHLVCRCSHHDQPAHPSR